MISTKVHAWVKQQVRDIPAGGDAVEVVVRKRRMVCTEAANTAIKHIKRTGRGYRNHRHYQARILRRSHRQTRLNQQATTANCG